MNNGVVRTKRALKDALISLLKEKEFRAITISEIAARADYSRATIYAHYQYKEDLLDELIGEILEGFTTAFREPYENQREKYELRKLTASTVKIFQYIDSNKEAFRLLLKGSNLGFQDKLGEAIRDIYNREYELLFPQIPPSINREIFINQSVYTLLGLIFYWVQSDFQYSANYMTNQMLEIAKLMHR